MLRKWLINAEGRDLMCPLLLGKVFSWYILSKATLNLPVSAKIKKKKVPNGVPISG